MLKVAILITVISAVSFSQTMKLDIKDSLTYRALILDSINIKNKTFGIDTTIAIPKIIDFTELFIINSVQSKRYFDISLNNNQLTVNSNERIENIKMFDLLGREVINANVNNTNYQTNINSENNSLFYFISIRTDKGLYNSKLINSTYENLQIANVMPISSNWIFTLYKFGYNTETIESNKLPVILKYTMRRIPLIVKWNVNFNNLTYNTYKKNINDKDIDRSFDEFNVREFYFSHEMFRSMHEEWKDYLNLCFHYWENFDHGNVVNKGGFNIYIFEVDTVQDIATFMYVNSFTPDKEQFQAYKCIKIEVREFNKSLKKLFEGKTTSITIPSKNMNGKYSDGFGTWRGYDYSYGELTSYEKTFLTGSLIINLAN